MAKFIKFVGSRDEYISLDQIVAIHFGEDDSGFEPEQYCSEVRLSNGDTIFVHGEAEEFKKKMHRAVVSDNVFFNINL